MTRQKEYFFCYNKQLFTYLYDQKHINYITVAIAPHSGKTFSLFKIDDELNRALNEYKN